MKRTKEIWRGMWERCGGLNGNLKGSTQYKGKVFVCDEWRSFEKFIEDMGLAPEGYSIDRIENSKGYYKSNCRWACRTTQTRNRTITKTIVYEEKTWFIKELADHLGVRYDTLWRRIQAGWKPEDLSKKPSRGNLSEDQLKNKRKRFLTYQGEDYALSVLASKLEICPEVLWGRFIRGWNPEDWGKPSKVKNQNLKVKTQ